MKACEVTIAATVTDDEGGNATIGDETVARLWIIGVGESTIHVPVLFPWRDAAV